MMNREEEIVQTQKSKLVDAYKLIKKSYISGETRIWEFHNDPITMTESKNKQEKTNTEIKIHIEKGIGFSIISNIPSV